jgi:hypothetical protein
MVTWANNCIGWNTARHCTPARDERADTRPVYDYLQHMKPIRILTIIAAIAAGLFAFSVILLWAVAMPPRDPSRAHRTLRRGDSLL